MRVRRSVLGMLAIAALVVVAALVGPAAASAAVGPCDLYAAPNGSDGASGSATAPLKTVQRLADELSSGQVGCLRAGTYGDPPNPGESFKQLKVTKAGISLTSAPGETAQIDARVWVAKGANGVTIENLYLDGANTKTLPSPTVTAQGAVFRHDEVTNDHTGICFSLGDASYGEAIGTVIEENRIHACGAIPSTNQHHGIYIADAQNTTIRSNWIYDNVNRGIQLYPSARGTTVTGNVIYGNGEGLIFSGDGSTASSNNTVSHNVISGSDIRRNVESYYEAGAPIGTGNVVKENCTYGGATKFYAGSDNSGVERPEVGFTAANNTVAQPVFVDAQNGDFDLTAKSGCASVLPATPDGRDPGLVAEADGEETPAGELPAAEPPATEAPATEPPKSEPPATEAPKTEPPATEPPVTEAPAAEPPATSPPAVELPATEAPGTQAPASEPPAGSTGVGSPTPPSAGEAGSPVSGSAAKTPATKPARSHKQQRLVQRGCRATTRCQVGKRSHRAPHQLEARGHRA